MSFNANYHSYLLRVWRDNPDHPWRASLQSTITEEKILFADLQKLLAFLLDELIDDEDLIKPAGLARLATSPEQPALPEKLAP